jgi:hypothetical protein
VAAAATAFVLAWLVWGMPLSLTIAAATRHGRELANQLDRGQRGLFLQPVGGKRRLRRHSPLALPADRRSAHPAAAGGVLLQRAHRRRTGFGAPVAITASCGGLGFEPIMAASLALIANTAPVAFGSLGIPVTTLGGLLAPMLSRRADDDPRAVGHVSGSCRSSRWRFRRISAHGRNLAGGAGRRRRSRSASSRSQFRRAGADRRVVRSFPDRRRLAPARLASGEEFTEGARFTVITAAATPDTPSRVFRAYATYGILILTVLIGQTGTSQACRTCSRRPM